MRIGHRTGIQHTAIHVQTLTVMGRAKSTSHSPPCLSSLCPHLYFRSSRWWQPMVRFENPVLIKLLFVSYGVKFFKMCEKYICAVFVSVPFFVSQQCSAVFMVRTLLCWCFSLGSRDVGSSLRDSIKSTADKGCDGFLCVLINTLGDLLLPRGCGY